jgi:hypothetical protein
MQRWRELKQTTIEPKQTEQTEVAIIGTAGSEPKQTKVEPRVSKPGAETNYF